MLRRFVSALLIFFAFALTAISQTTTSNSTETAVSPTPKPAPKRRTFDQFDLSNGVRIDSPEKAATGFGSGGSATFEFVDQRTYDGVRRLVEYAQKMSAEYRAAVIGPNFKPNDWETLSALNRKVNATYKVTELFHDGVLDQTPLKDPSNLLLLEESQATLREAGSVAAIYGGWSKNPTMLAKMAAKYNAEETVGIENTRRAVLIAMLERLSSNFSQLLSQIAIAK